MNYNKFVMLVMLAVLLTLATISVANAACTQTVVYTPDGRQVVCQICTDSVSGQASTICY